MKEEWKRKTSESGAGWRGLWQGLVITGRAGWTNAPLELSWCSLGQHPLPPATHVPQKFAAVRGLPCTKRLKGFHLLGGDLFTTVSSLTKPQRHTLLGCCLTSSQSHLSWRTMCSGGTCMWDQFVVELSCLPHTMVYCPDEYTHLIKLMVISSNISGQLPIWGYQVTPHAMLSSQS